MKILEINFESASIYLQLILTWGQNKLQNAKLSEQQR